MFKLQVKKQYSNKKLIIAFFILAVMTVFSCYGANAAVVGDTAGSALNTDIKVYINGVRIAGYNVNGRTYVVAEDLRPYGFKVVWNEAGRSLSITKGPAEGSFKNIPDNESDTGSIAFPYVYSDITVDINGKKVDSYNLQGYTVVGIDDLAEEFGGLIWDDAKREAYISTVIPVTSVSVSLARSSFKTGEICDFEVIIYPDDATDKTYNLDIEGGGAVLLDNNSASCVYDGKVRITATASNGVSGYNEITIIDIEKYADEVRREFYIIVNNHRRSQGLRELEANPELQAYADIRAAEQRLNFGHTRPDGSAAGSGWHASQNYMNTRYAENAISVHSLDSDPRKAAEYMFSRWRDSEGHNRHMLYNFDESITMALGLAPELDSSGRVTSGGIWASGY